ncbi:MAG: hypothetical protein ACI4KF_01615 [Huintestinicola sp.]
MADLIQITTPAAPKDYGMNHNQNRQQMQQQNATGQVFDLGNQAQVVKTNDRSEGQGQQDLKDDSGASLTRSTFGIIKDPSSALNAARELISHETLNILKENGDTELLSKLTEFADEVVLSPESLSADMMNQQKGITVFGDKLWSILKNLSAQVNSPEFTSALTDFAKAAANVSSKNEILNSLSANFRYLSRELAPSKAVSDELASAADALTGPDAPRNYDALKSTLIKLIGYTEKSLLLSDETKNFLPLIIHNMSRYSSSPSSLRESFDALVKLSENLELPKEETENISQGVPLLSLSREQTAESGIDKLLTELETLTGTKNIPEALEKLFDSYILNNPKLTPEEKQMNLIDRSTAESNKHLVSMTKLLAAGAKHMAQRIDRDSLTRILSTVDPGEGLPSVRKTLGSVIPNTPAMRDALDSILNDFTRTRNLDDLIERLSVIINNIDDSEKQILLAQGLNTILGEMAANKENTCSGQTSMDILADFLTKNIDNSFLQNLTGMKQSDMVQSMLTAPGVFTPLIHQFVPLDAFGIRAFGEMWIDPSDDEITSGVKNNRKGSSEGSSSGSHVFLCFDIEDTGYFELEIYEKDKELSVMLLCPDGQTDKFGDMSKLIPKIASENGYRIANSIIDTLRVKRSLNQIFPRLNEQRSGLNVKV